MSESVELILPSSEEYLILFLRRLLLPYLISCLGPPRLADDRNSSPPIRHPRHLYFIYPLVSLHLIC
jgi:hypothetical protein